MKENANKIDSLVINANTIAFASYGVKETVHELNTAFVVDPMTYIFALPFDAITIKEKESEKPENLKLSYRLLAAQYAGPFLECIKLKPVEPRQFLRAEKATDDSKAAVENVIAFQRGLPGSLTSLIRYRRFLKRKQIAEELRPSFLLAPYFHFSSTKDPWYYVSLNLSQMARNFRGDLPLFPVICPSRYCLESVGERNQIVKDYSKSDGLVIWVPGMRDDRSSYTLLSSLTDLVREFSSYGKPVVLLHAGYYGALLTKVGLSGFSTGVCHGESKALRPSGGRLPAPTKYYITQIHSLRLPDVAAGFFNSEHNAKLLCHCSICASIRKRLGFAESDEDTPSLVGRFFSEIKLEEAQSHFMICRAKEVETLDKEDKLQALLRLKSELAFVQTEMLPPPESTLSNHLERWKLALS